MVHAYILKSKRNCNSHFSRHIWHSHFCQKSVIEGNVSYLSGGRIWTDLSQPHPMPSSLRTVPHKSPWFQQEEGQRPWWVIIEIFSTYSDSKCWIASGIQSCIPANKHFPRVGAPVKCQQGCIPSLGLELWLSVDGWLHSCDDFILSAQSEHYK